MADEQICLEAGFEVELGGEFLAQIGEGNVRDYIGGLEYFNGELEAIYHEDGRIVKRTNGREFQYLIRDHLSNTRVLFADPDENGVADIIGEWSYYPNGLTHNGIGSNVNSPKMQYQFGGKELNEDLGLDLSDFGARYLDRALNRWVSVDPLAYRYVSISPYTYVGNMPTKAIDPDGKRIIITNAYKNTLTSLAKIAATNKGVERLNSLISRTKSYYTEAIWWTLNSGYDPSGTDGKAKTMYFVGTAWMPYLEGGRNRSHYVLAHELDHAYRHGKRETRKKKEWEASKFGNNQRAIYGETALREKYSLPGRGIERGTTNDVKINDDLRTANLDNEKVTNFKEIDDISTDGAIFLGFSYEKSEGGGASKTEYILSIRQANGEFAYRKFDDIKEYNAAVDRAKKTTELEDK